MAYHKAAHSPLLCFSSIQMISLTTSTTQSYLHMLMISLSSQPPPPSTEHIRTPKLTLTLSPPTSATTPCAQTLKKPRTLSSTPRTPLKSHNSTSTTTPSLTQRHSNSLANQAHEKNFFFEIKIFSTRKIGLLILQTTVCAARMALNYATKSHFHEKLENTSQGKV
eukprot:Pompholyxophrys_punicea_v1_NODE_852_length_1210_cov_6.277056.p2 type:complete len:166 gc:universal NODE_852_length_1210_cov_6.277056:688-191(-)